jgi:hypothetical protein
MFSYLWVEKNAGMYLFLFCSKACHSVSSHVVKKKEGRDSVEPVPFGQENLSDSEYTIY